MTRLSAFITLLMFVFASCKDEDHVSDAVIISKTQEEVIDTSKKSIKAYAQNKVGPARFTIQYYSPAVRGREIWGGLVPYDKVWVTGAHNATSIESDQDFIIGETRIPAGKYAFFTIPGKEEWTIIINKNWDQHQADEYKQEDDLLRMNIKPDTLTYRQERLMYDIDQTAQKLGNLLMMWERLKLVVPVRIAD
ncbi:MAG TPA: DUF2911 domain-containing protein [Chitinophagaceae bacterium]|nr:DUF2911 domain-containing protein [Chitinophagaceae bacterium]